MDCCNADLGRKGFHGLPCCRLVVPAMSGSVLLADGETTTSGLSRSRVERSRSVISHLTLWMFVWSPLRRLSTTLF